MRRVLKVTAAVLAFVVVAAGSVAFWYREAIALVLDGADVPANTADDVLDYLAKHPDQVALATWEVADEANGLFWNADRAQPLASTVKVLALADYAAQVDPTERVTLAEWERFYLPGTDGAAHPAALKELGRRDAYTAADVAHAMIRFSDNAAFDWLLFRTGHSSGAPHPLSGEMLGWPKCDAYDDTSAWQLATAQVVGKVPPAFDVSLAQQVKCAAAMNNRGTARDFAKLMERVVNGELPNADRMRAELEWPMKNASMQRDFETYGTKGGSLAGVLTGATYAKAKGAQRPRVVALFLQRLPVGLWLQLMQTYAHQDFERRMFTDPAFLEKVKARLYGAAP